MTCQTHIRLLGQPQIESDGQPVTGLRSQKALAVLAYLAVQRKPVSRQQLVHLFWGKYPVERGQSNLRWILNHLTSHLPGCLISTRQTVHFPDGKHCWLDLAVFEARVAQGDLSALSEAATLYRCEFMAGMTLEDCVDFDLWLASQRTHWQQRVVTVLEDLVARALDQDLYATAQEFAARWLELDPLSEPAHQQMMRVYMLTGRAQQALAQYETCRRTLQSELDVEPDAATRELYRQICTGTFAMQAEPVSSHLVVPLIDRSGAVLPERQEPHNNLPAQLTPFFGREEEMARLASLFQRRDYRLITLLGLGGSGKTRLALQAAAQYHRVFRDGVCFASLAGLTSAEQIAGALTDALQLTRSNEQAPIDQLGRYLHNKNLCLILDDFGHLHDAIGLLLTILRQSAEVVILVTARTRLGLHCEDVLLVPGLPLPPDDTPDQAAAAPAVQLFADRARRVQKHFTIDAETLAPVGRICRLLDGLPLAIELAAAWVRLLPCHAIARELEQGWNLLTANWSDVPARHRSIQELFDHTWATLTPDEQQVLCRLATFPGEFTATAAHTRTGTTHKELAGLVDKALLKVTHTGNYAQHPLWLQYLHRQMPVQPAGAWPINT